MNIESGTTNQGPAPPGVVRMVAVVLAAPDRDWKARKLGGLAGLSYSRLRESFPAAQGQTLHEYLQRTRLEPAR